MDIDTDTDMNVSSNMVWNIPTNQNVVSDLDANAYANANMDYINYDAELEMQDLLMHHIVLPRILPQQKSPHLNQTEHDLMKDMVETVKNLSSWIPSKTVEMFNRLYKVHTECTSENVSTQINELEPGDTFAMFVRFQRCAIMIHVPPEERVNNVQHVIVATIPGSLHPSEIYEHESDIEVIILFQFIKNQTYMTILN